MTGKTLYDKIWDAHRVAEDANGETILYIDLHLIHEVTTPQAFAGLRAAGRPVHGSTGLGSASFTSRGPVLRPDASRRCPLD